jgi:hypothetical protein
MPDEHGLRSLTDRPLLPYVAPIRPGKLEHCTCAPRQQTEIANPGSLSQAPCHGAAQLFCPHEIGLNRCRKYIARLKECDTHECYRGRGRIHHSATFESTLL